MRGRRGKQALSATPLRSGPDDDLGLPWKRLGDGRVWRLRRGEDYQVETKALTVAAEVAANRMGKVACVAGESIARARYLEDYAWIRFVDHDVLVGSPCPCGSRELVRTHPQYAECPACGAHLRLSTPRRKEQFAGTGTEPSMTAEVGGGPAGAERARSLADARKAIIGARKALSRAQCRHDDRFALAQYTDAALVATERTQGGQRLYARAVDPLGMAVLLWWFIRGDQSAAAHDPVGSGEARVHRWPVAPFGSVIDLDRMPGLTEDQVPEREGFAKSHHSDDRRGRGRLHRFSRVTLLHREELPGRERFYGHALDQDDDRTLIYADYPLLEQARLKDPDDREADLHFVYRWPTAPFGAAIDLGSLSG